MEVNIQSEICDNQVQLITSEMKMKNKRLVFCKKLDKIILPVCDGYEFVKLHNIISCESDNIYTKVSLVSGLEIYALTSLLSVDEVLRETNFMRIHKRYIINLHLINKIMRKDGGFIRMTSGQEIPISRSKKQLLFEAICLSGTE